MKRIQSTPRQRYVEPAQPPSTRTVGIPISIITALALGCMAVAIIGAMAGAFK